MSAKFPKHLRLSGAGEYQKVFDQGKRIQGKFLIMLYCPNGFSYSRLGLVVSNRSAGSIVRRNSIKRQIREFFRLNLSKLDGLDFVFISRKEITKSRALEVWQNLQYFQRKLGRAENP